MICRDRTGKDVYTNDKQLRYIKFLYDCAAGNLMLRALIRPEVSRAVGKLLNKKISKLLIGPFIKSNSIDMSIFEKENYRNYNEFFRRRIRADKRPIDRNTYDVISPCDGKLSVYPIKDDSSFFIKDSAYTMQSLLKNSTLAKKYCGGVFMLFRLTVDDYHRYCYISDGRESNRVRIQGVYHTVNPYAVEKRKIYRENTRVYSVLDTEHFGRVLMIEVGAMLVGKIVNHKRRKSVKRGDEKGYFEFGGSTIILCFEKDMITVDKDILKNTAEEYETIVKMGEKIGTALH